MIIGICMELRYSKNKGWERIMMSLIWGRRQSISCRFKNSNLGSVWARWKIRLARL